MVTGTGTRGEVLPAAWFCGTVLGVFCLSCVLQRAEALEGSLGVLLHNPRLIKCTGFFLDLQMIKHKARLSILLVLPYLIYCGKGFFAAVPSVSLEITFQEVFFYTSALRKTKIVTII